ncbi:c-type cytochrome [Pedobacter steynii]
MLRTKLKLLEIFCFTFISSCIISSCSGDRKPAQKNDLPKVKEKSVWHAPDESTIPKNAKGEMIRYGKDLIANTSAYFGPKGTLGKFTNGLNCQNCHLDAGTRIFGNNYAAVMSSYPKITARSGKITSPIARIKGCFERSLNGKMPDSTSKEIRAMIAYMEWLNQGVEGPEGMYGRGTEKIALLDRPADPKREHYSMHRNVKAAMAKMEKV